MKRIGLIAAAVVVTASGCSFQSSETTITTAAATTIEAPPPTLGQAESDGAMASAQTVLDAWAIGDFPTVRSISPDAAHDLLGLAPVGKQIAI